MGISYFLDKVLEDLDEIFGGINILLGIVLIGFIFVGVFVQFGNYSRQLSRYEEIRKTQTKIELHQEKLDDLTIKFEKLLSDKYPSLEKEIFKDISAQKTSDQLLALLNKYPELKSSHTITQLVKQVRELTDKVYEKKMHLEDLCKTSRYKHISPWLIGMPETPKDIKELVYPENYSGEKK